MSTSAPYGGTQSFVEVDLDQHKLLAHGLSAQDVPRALAQQNIVLPAGDQKIGAIDFLVETNASPVNGSTFNSLPIGDASTLSVVVGVKAKIPQIEKTLSPGVKIKTFAHPPRRLSTNLTLSGVLWSRPGHKPPNSIVFTFRKKIARR